MTTMTMMITPMTRMKNQQTIITITKIPRENNTIITITTVMTIKQQ